MKRKKLHLRRLLAFLSLIVVAPISGMVNRPICAQDSEQIGASESEAVRDLLEEQSELEGFLAELKEERARVVSKLDEVRRLISLEKRLSRVQRAQEVAMESGQRERALIAEARKIEHALDLAYERRDLQELSSFLRELQDVLEEIAPENVKVVVPKLETAAKAVSELCEQVSALEKERVADTDSQRKAQVQIDELRANVETTHELVDLVEKLIWAIEEEQSEARVELLAEIKHFRLRALPEAISNLDSTSLDKRPVQITDMALREYKKLDFDLEIVPLLRTHCFDCHSDDSSYGELNLEKLIKQKPLVSNRGQWINVIEQLKNRVMPPPDDAQPSESDRRTLVLALHNKIHDFDYSRVKNPGFEVARRLTHAEYDNTVSDLLGVQVRIASRFPKELSGVSGFDNSGNTLFVQPLLMERYLTAADEIVEEFLPRIAQTQQQQAAHRKLFFQSPTTPSKESQVAQSILSRFVARAFRRPLRDVEKNRLRLNYAAARESGQSHEDAVRAIVRETLISPYFLFRFEGVPEGRSEFPVGDWDLANRLSYFLWASMPDDELFGLAQSGQLHDRDVLATQVDRMLRDRRAKSLGEIFAAQWLGSQHVGTRVRLDPIDNPWCTDSLMTAIRNETALFFHALVIDNEPIDRLIDANFTFLNEELAKLYELGGVRGPLMRRVALSGRRRGGVLGHASVLAVTSFPGRTSPVVRGKWILETLLGTPPPPPPPNVSEFDEELAENERLTIREKLERHRQSPSCNACHSEMDPLGLSLERYDWFGRYRARYGRGRIDDRSSVPDGTTFEGLDGLRNVILDKRKDDLLRQTASKMLSYALGRQLEYYDEPAIRGVIAETKRSGNRLQPLIHQIVQSYPFLNKKLQEQVGATEY